MAASASAPWFDDRGPAAAFSAAASRLGLDVDPDEIRGRFDQHPAPHTLRALVEVAAGCGVEVRAFRADLEGLAEVPLPAIVHVQRPDRDEMAFAVLLERRDGEVVLADAPGDAPRTLTMNDFLRQWTGILATLTVRGRTVVPSAPKAGLLWKLGHWFEGAGEGPRPMFAARWLGLFGLLAAAVFGAWQAGSAAAGPSGGAAALVALLLVLAGVGASLALHQASVVTSVPSATPRLSSKICHRGGLTDCESVLASRWSSVFGIDLSALGIAFLVSAAALLAIAGLVPAAGSAPLLWLAIAFLLAAPEALFLVGVQIWPLRRICPLCMTVHGVVLVCAGLGVALLVQADVAPGELAWTVLPWAALQAIVFLLAFGLLVPFLDLALEARTNRIRLGWIAATPLGALSELIGRPKDLSRPVPSEIVVGRDDAPVRLEVLIHPMCSGCGPAVEQLVDLQSRFSEVLCVAFHVPPRDPASRGDLELCAAFAALGAHAGGEAAVARFLEQKANPWAALEIARRDVRELLADWTGLPVGDPRLDELLEQGRAAARRADELAVRLQRGTPTVLLGGRPWEAPVADLGALLARQPELLGAAIGVSLGPRRRQKG